MADSVQIQGGLKSGLPTLMERAFGYCTDTKELYIGTSAGNKLIASGNAAAGIFDLLTISAQTSVATAGNGAIFEDTEGHLVYKNLSGAATDINDKLTASPATNIAALSGSATLSEVITAFNNLLSALITAGIMNGGT